MTAPVVQIYARAENGAIGRDGRLPWHLPADLRHFRDLTMGKPIIMGRKNYEDIGRPLPRRTNIILTRQPDFSAAGCLIAQCTAARSTATCRL